MANATAGTNDNETKHIIGNHEIVSLVGTINKDGCHLHVSIADSAGNVIGGHLVGGMIVFTTLEIVIAECSRLSWKRVHDQNTGYPELEVIQRSI